MVLKINRKELRSNPLPTTIKYTRVPNLIIDVAATNH